MFFLLFTLPLFSQTMAADSGFNRIRHVFQPGRVDYGVNLGSEFTAVSGFGSGLTTQVAPHFFYNVSKRFRIGGGISIATTNYFNARSWFPNETTAPANGSFQTGSVFVSGQYLLSDRLTLSGSAYKIFPITKDPLAYNPFNPISRNGAQGVNFNVDYKIGEHMHIQAGFRYSQGVNPYSAGSFNSDPFQTGSYGNGFGSGHPRW